MAPVAARMGLICQASGVVGPPVIPPTDTTYTWSPIDVQFHEGVPAVYSLANHVIGNPALISINKNPAEEGTIAGVTWNGTAFVYDGAPGTGLAVNYVAAATGGEDPVHEFILPYAPTRPYLNTTPGGSGLQGAINVGGNPQVIPQQPAQVSALNGSGTLFEHLNGDWWDSALTPQGDVPFYAFDQGQADPPPVDVTALVKDWQLGVLQNYGFFFRQSGFGCEYFGPQYQNGVNGPFLDLTFADGTTSTITATVGGSLNQGSGTQWEQIYFEANNSVVFFDLPITKIATAILRLKLQNWHGAAHVQLFATRWTAQSAGTPPTLGLAWKYPNDVGLSADPAIIYCEDFPDTNFNTRGGWGIKQPYIDQQLLTVVGDVDVPITVPSGVVIPADPTYHPLKTGIKSLKFTVGPVAPDGVGFGGNAGWFYFHGFNNSRPTHLFARWYFMLGDSVNPLSPQAGKLSGLNIALDPNIAGKKLAQTGNFMAPTDDGYPNYVEPVSFTWVQDFLGMAPLDSAQNPLSVYGMRRLDEYMYMASVGPQAGIFDTLKAWNYRHLAFKKSRWYCIDVEVDMGTATQNNGVLRMSVDGRLAFEITNALVRNDARTFLETFALQFFSQASGSSQGGSAINMSVFHSKLVFATQYIGPMRKQ